MTRNRVFPVILVLVLMCFNAFPGLASSADTIPPTVSITSPASGTNYTTAGTVTITASASDNRKVSKVEIYDNNVLKATDTRKPFTYTWSFTSAHNGTHNWTAKAYDSSGNSKVSGTVTVTVNIGGGDTISPTVSITSPASGTTYTTAQTVTINASASDNVGVTKVEFYDGATLRGTDTSSPYSNSWSFTSANNGTHNWTAKAYDAAGNSKVSSIAGLTVNIGIGDTISPTVSITSPASGTTYTTAQTVTINASASDNVGVTKVEFYDGATLRGTDTSSPYSNSWSFTSANNGTHNWTAKAYDAAGNSKVSSIVSLTVNIDTGAPTGSVTINSGAAYAKSTATTLTLSASDPNGVSQMCVSNTTSCTAWEAYATTKAWAVTAGDGSKTVYVRYMDSLGNATASPYSDTIFIDTVPPQCSVIINNGAAYTNSASVTLALSATDPNPGSGLAQMCVSTTNSSCSSWVTYAASMNWTLTTGDGAKAVYAWFKDNAGNVTATPSTTSDSIILDATSPSIPAGLAASAVSSSQINLSWSPSFDTGGSGLAGYKVYRSASQVGTATATNYSDNGLAANTQYCYKVASYDVAGNTSTQSAQVCATTQAGSSTGGDTIWAKKFGGAQNDLAYSVVVDSVGNIIAVGTFTGTADLGGGSVTSTGSSDMYVAKYSPSGIYQWAKHFGGSGSVTPRAVALDANGNVLVTGSFLGTVNFGGGSVTSGYNTADTFVAKYSSSGVYQWSKTFIGGGMAESGYGIAADSSGNVIVAGDFLASVDFGGGYLSGYGTHNIFLAKYSPSGAHIWSKALGYGMDDIPYGIAVDNNDNILVTGYFVKDLDFGGGLFVSKGSADVFLAKYSSSGAHLWSRSFGSTSSDIGYGVAVDVSNNVVVTGYFMGTVDFGGEVLTSTGQMKVFVAKYSSSGSYLWAKDAGSVYTNRGNDVAVDGSGNVVVTGQFYSPADFGGGPIAGGGGIDIFVAKYSSSGTNLWSAGFGGPYTDAGMGIAVDNTGEIIVTGYFFGTADFGGPILTSASNDIFLLKLAP